MTDELDRYLDKDPDTGGIRPLSDEAQPGVGIPEPIPSPESQGMMGGWATRIENYFRRKPPKDLPEIGEIPNADWAMMWRNMQAASASFFEFDEKHRAEAFRDIYPGSKVTQDKQGNWMITIPIKGKDRTFYFDKPGPSEQDLINIFNVISWSAGPAKLASMSRNLLARMGLLGAGEATAEATRQITSSVGMGTSRELDPTSVGMAAVLSGAFLGVGDKLYKAGRHLIKAGKFSKTSGGKLVLTDSGKRWVERAGWDPDDLTPETIRELRKVMHKAGTPQEAMKAAEAKSLNIRLLRSQITDDPKDQMVSIQALREDAGPGPRASILEDLRQTGAGLQARGREAAGAIRGGRLNEPLEGIENARVAMDAARAAEKEAARAAKDSAQRGGVRIKSASIADMRKFIGNRVGLDLDPQLSPEIWNVFRKMTSAGRLARGSTPKSPKFKIQSMQLNRLEVLYKKLGIIERNNTTYSPTGAVVERGEVAVIASKVKRAYQEYLEGLADDAIKSGDVGAIQSFKEYKRIWHTMKSRYEDNAAIRNILMKDESGNFVYSAKEAADSLWGSAAVGNKRMALKNINDLKKTLVDIDPDRWLEVKQEIAVKMFYNPKTGENMLFTNTNDPTAMTPAVNGIELAKNIKNMSKMREFYEAVFTTDEIKFWRKLGRVAERAGTLKSGSAFDPTRLITGDPVTRGIFHKLMGHFRAMRYYSHRSKPLRPPKSKATPLAAGVAGQRSEKQDSPALNLLDFTLMP